MNIKFVLILLLILISAPVFAHEHNEASYQHAWCKLHNGIEEYENKDFTRVDCLTSTNAVDLILQINGQKALDKPFIINI